MPAASWRMYPARTSSWCEATTASAGTSLSVGTKLFDIRTRLPFALQFPLDGLLDLIVRNRAVDEDPVDEEGRSAVHARLVPGFLVLVDERLLLAAVEALVEFHRVEPERLRMILQILDRQLLLIAEHLVVHLPELALVGGAGARLRGLGSEGMDVERIVAKHQPHLPVVFLHQPLDHRSFAAAVGTLEIAEFDDGHLGAARSARRPLGLHFDARKLGRLERHLHVVLLAQLIEHLAHVLAPLLLLDHALAPRLEVLAGLPLRHLALVLLVERLDLVVARVGDAVHVPGLDPLIERLAFTLSLALRQP